MAARPDEFVLELLKKLVRAAFNKAEPKIPVGLGHLRDSLEEEITGPASGRLLLPRSYAKYVHDPLGARDKANAPPYIWFINPADDPRINAQGEMVRKLTSREFYMYLGQGKIRVQESVGPMNLHSGEAGFFDNDRGMSGFVEEAHAIAQPDFNQHIQEFLGNRLKIEGSVSVEI